MISFAMLVLAIVSLT
ncbi:hypothetical protein [Sinanaerobacter sp. ZZT-01]